MSHRSRGLLLIVAVVVLLRLPFLNQAIQGDDIYYLAGAQHAQVDPLHPNHTRYVFLGDLVDMRGHPHPPLDAWLLGGLLAAGGDIREVPFHAAFLALSLLAAVSMYALALRYSPHPVWATLLFCAVPAFVINGNSLESDLPLLAFWMAAVALFVYGRLALASVALALAAMAAYQAVLLTPILWAWTWWHDRRSKSRWIVALVPPLAIAAWLGFEFASTGRVPVAVLQGHFTTYGFQALANKLSSALMLAIHLLWIVFPPLLWGVWKRRDRFLWAWIGIFFPAALAIFFAGSARYLLPLAAPVCLLVSYHAPRWLAAGFAAQMALSIALAAVNYQHWAGYRDFVASVGDQFSARRVWINGEWGLRYYAEAEGGLPLRNGQAVRPGDLILTSELAYPVDISTGGGVRTLVAQRDIRASLPLRIIGLGTRSGYSTSASGFLPFDVSAAPIDRVRLDLVVERKPTESLLRMNAPEAPQQIVSGVYALEGGQFRWMARRAVILLKSANGPLRVVCHRPEAAPARTLTIALDGEIVYSGPIESPITTRSLSPTGPTATLTLEVDKTFSVPGDRRELGIVLAEAGFAR